MEKGKEPELEVKTLNRTQKHQLRSILLGKSATIHGHGHSRPSSSSFGSSSEFNCTPSCTTSGGVTNNGVNTSCTSSNFNYSSSSPIPLQIYRSAEVSEKILRVADPEIESLKKQRLDHIFTDGEEKLRDLQQSLLKVASVPVPDVGEIEEERYNRLYPVLPKGSYEDRIRTTGPPPPPGSSGGEDESDFDYDLDDEDEEFLLQKRKQDRDFNLTDSLFESAIAWFLTHKMKTDQDFTRLQQEIGSLGEVSPPLPLVPNQQLAHPYWPYPLALLSSSELDSIINYFLAKQKKIEASQPIWQPTHVSQPLYGQGQGRKSSPSTSNKKQRFSLVPSPKSTDASAYKIFRPAIQVEPKVLRSHTKHSGLTSGAIHRLKCKAESLKGFATHFQGVMRYHFHGGLKQRKQTLHNVRALEEAWDLDDNGEDALIKFFFRKRNEDVVKIDVDNNNNVDCGRESAQGVAMEMVNNSNMNIGSGEEDQNAAVIETVSDINIGSGGEGVQNMAGVEMVNNSTSTNNEGTSVQIQCSGTCCSLASTSTTQKEGLILQSSQHHQMNGCRKVTKKHRGLMISAPF